MNGAAFYANREREPFGLGRPINPARAAHLFQVILAQRHIHPGIRHILAGRILHLAIAERRNILDSHMGQPIPVVTQVI